MPAFVTSSQTRSTAARPRAAPYELSSHNNNRGPTRQAERASDVTRTASDTAPLGSDVSHIAGSSLQTPIHGSHTGSSRLKGAQASSKAQTAENTVVRTGGGKVWTDASLLEWDPSHFRLYVGNLGGEVNDASLAAAFAAYPSLSKARVVRDKRTGKSKGFGFLSFAEANDVLAAWRRMNGKYVGSRPVQLERAETEVTATTVTQRSLDRKRQKSDFNRIAQGRSLATNEVHDAHRDSTSKSSIGPASLINEKQEDKTPGMSPAGARGVATPATLTSFVPRGVRKR
ncbi:hypothetical protein PYCC9005_004557 [Savitreella phatthalungensis]